MKYDHEKKLQSEIDQLKQANQELSKALENIKQRAQRIREGKEDGSTEAFHIKLVAEQAIAKNIT